VELTVFEDSFGSTLECGTITVIREPATLLKTAINRPLSITFAKPNENPYAIVYSNKGGRVGQVVGGNTKDSSSVCYMLLMKRKSRWSHLRVGWRQYSRRSDMSESER